MAGVVIIALYISNYILKTWEVGSKKLKTWEMFVIIPLEQFYSNDSFSVDFIAVFREITIKREYCLKLSEWNFKLNSDIRTWKLQLSCSLKFKFKISVVRKKKWFWWFILKLLNFWQLFLTLILVTWSLIGFFQSFQYDIRQTVYCFLLEVPYQSKYHIIYYIVKYKRCNIKS